MASEVRDPNQEGKKRQHLLVSGYLRWEGEKLGHGLILKLEKGYIFLLKNVVKSKAGKECKDKAIWVTLSLKCEEYRIKIRIGKIS